MKGPLYAIYATLNAEGGHRSHARTDLRYVFPLQEPTALPSRRFTPGYFRTRTRGCLVLLQMSLVILNSGADEIF